MPSSKHLIDLPKEAKPHLVLGTTTTGVSYLELNVTLPIEPWQRNDFEASGTECVAILLSEASGYAGTGRYLPTHVAAQFEKSDVHMANCMLLAKGGGTHWPAVGYEVYPIYPDAHEALVPDDGAFRIYKYLRQHFQRVFEDTAHHWYSS